VNFRSRPHTLVRYREFDWKTAARGALKKIIIGPAAERDIANRFVRDCIRAFHGGAVEVETSKIPYRAV